MHAAGPAAPPRPLRPRRPSRPGPAAVAALMLAGIAVAAASGHTLALGTAVHRLVERAYTAWEMRSLAAEPHVRAGRFTVYYPAGDRSDGRIVARDLRAVAGRVFKDLGTNPPGPLVVRVESRSAMAAVFGTRQAEAPLGAYWRGTVWLLAPEAWAGAPGQRQRVFDSLGPLPHELAHLADDWRSGGRTPAFLDEGIAQYEEWRINGYVWNAPQDAGGRGYYSWRQLQDSFDHLPDQALAYHQALAVVRAVAARAGGLASIRALLADLGRGEPADHALEAVAGAGGLQALASGSAWLG